MASGAAVSASWMMAHGVKPGTAKAADGVPETIHSISRFAAGAPRRSHNGYSA